MLFDDFFILFDNRFSHLYFCRFETIILDKSDRIDFEFCPGTSFYKDR